MPKLYAAAILVLLSLTTQAQHLVSATAINTATANELSLLSPHVQYDVRYYKIVYNTTDVDGSPTIASGGLGIPMQSNCNLFPLIAYDHGTVLRDEDVPSRGNTEAFVPMVMASTGAISVAPDYLGLGDNPGLHPYLHAESEATATLDLIRAAREFLADSTQITHNGEVFVTGYSQGGHAAMATVKYVQDNNLLSEFNIIGAGPASGPYNLSGTQQEVLVSDAPYSNPGYVLYLFFAMEKVYGNVFDSYSDILYPPYDTLIPPYFDGTHNMATVNALLPDTLSGFIRDSVLTNFANDSVNKNHPIWQFLTANDNYDWNPSFPMELYYCLLDEQVDYNNALDAEAAMQANGANVDAVMKGLLNHSGCFLPSMNEALDFFISLRTACSPIGLDEAEAHGVSLYPNPARDLIQIEGLEGAAVLKAYDATGRMIYRSEISEGRPLNVSEWSEGLYLISISTDGTEFSTKLKVQH